MSTDIPFYAVFERWSERFPLEVDDLAADLYRYGVSPMPSANCKPPRGQSHPTRNAP